MLKSFSLIFIHVLLMFKMYLEPKAFRTQELDAVDHVGVFLRVQQALHPRQDLGPVRASAKNEMKMR